MDLPKYFHSETGAQFGGSGFDLGCVFGQFDVGEFLAVDTVHITVFGRDILGVHTEPLGAYDLKGFAGGGPQRAASARTRLSSRLSRP